MNPNRIKDPMKRKKQTIDLYLTPSDFLKLADGNNLYHQFGGVGASKSQKLALRLL